MKLLLKALIWVLLDFFVGSRSSKGCRYSETASKMSWEPVFKVEMREDPEGGAMEKMREKLN